MADTNIFSTVNRLRLRSLLEAHGLNRPLGDRELALQLLDAELRLERAESALGEIADALRERGTRPPEDGEGPRLG